MGTIGARVQGVRFVLLVLTVVACHDRPSAPASTPTSAPAAKHGAGRDRWRGGGVYVDGTPVGALRYAELPRAMQPVWETQKKVLPFKRGEQVRYEETKSPRFRIADYVTAMGVALADVKEVHVMGAHDSAIIITRDDLVKHADELLVKFAGETWGKPIPVIRGIEAGTSFDDIKALAIYVAKKPPTLTADQTLELDGVAVKGIPYHGEPMRNGVRVYVDDKLAVVLKRNELPLGKSEFDLTDVLKRNGVATRGLARAELIYEEERTTKLASADLAFTFENTGSIKIGNDLAEAVAIYSN